MNDTKQKMTTYIENTKIKDTTKYELRLDELLTFRMLIVRDYFDAVELAFNYGRAKGYRLAQREIKNGKAD